jgi:hypothetical protein
MHNAGRTDVVLSRILAAVCCLAVVLPEASRQRVEDGSLAAIEGYVFV